MNRLKNMFVFFFQSKRCFFLLNRIPVLAAPVWITELAKLVSPAKGFDVFVFPDMLEKTAVVF